MNSSPAPRSPSTVLPLVGLLALLWLAGLGMRITIMSAPPVIPLIREDLGMSETQVGLLIGLPLVVFALASVPVSLIAARLGSSMTLTVGYLIAAVAAAARGAADGVLMLYATTLLLGLGIAIAQIPIPSLLREWTPGRMGLASAVSGNGILVGVATAPALTHPIVLPLVGGSWRWSLVVWACPVFAIAIIFLVVRARLPADRFARETSRRWGPDWRSPLAWLLGLTFGCNNCLFFGTNAFLADYLVHAGRPDLVGTAIGSLNGAQIVASVVLLLFAQRFEGRALPFVVCGLSALAGICGIVLAQGFWIVAWAAVVGFSLAITFALTLLLPARLGAAEDVPRLSAAMFTISYTMAVIVPAISGALWDWTGQPAFAFVPLAISAALLAVSGLWLAAHRRGGAPG